MPAEQVFGPRRGVVVARGRPQHPALAVAMRKQGQQLLTVPQTIPADRAVAQGRCCDLTVAGDVDAPRASRDRDVPLLGSLAVEETQIPLCAQQEALAVRGNG